MFRVPMAVRSSDLTFWTLILNKERGEEGVENQSAICKARRERNYKARVFRAMTDRHQRKLIWSLNARCVSIGLVLALSNCSESGGEPDAMLDIHHPGTGLESHHQQFHNSYGNIKIHHFNILLKIARPPSSSDRSTEKTIMYIKYNILSQKERSFIVDKLYRSYDLSYYYTS